MKRTIIILALSAYALSACGGQTSTTQTTTSRTTSAAPAAYGLAAKQACAAITGDAAMLGNAQAPDGTLGLGTIAKDTARLLPYVHPSDLTVVLNSVSDFQRALQALGQSGSPPQAELDKMRTDGLALAQLCSRIEHQ